MKSIVKMKNARLVAQADNKARLKDESQISVLLRKRITGVQ